MSDSTFSRSVRIERPASEVFAWHERKGAFQRLMPPWQKIELISQLGGIRDGATVKLRTKIGPVWAEWAVRHRDYVAGAQFRDEQERGPFAKWEHLHRVTPEIDPEADRGAVSTACTLTDEITYRLPFGALGRIFGGGFARRELERVFTYRHSVTRADVQLAERYASVRAMTFLVSGASGLVARSLIPLLETQGHHVRKLVRGEARSADEFTWDPEKGVLPPAALRGVDAIVHLAGENVGARWTPERRERIMQSRVLGTRTIVQALLDMERARARTKPFVFICASGAGIYGDRGDEVLDETSTEGKGFLADVCRAWEREAIGAEAVGVRTVRLRTGVVLTPAGGALAKMLPAFQWGAGGKLASGRQWMSWISIDDLVGAIYHAVLNQRCDGAVNAVAPGAVTNREFAAALGRVLRRPAILPVPAFALRTMFGEMADETVIGGARVRPAKLTAADYGFRHENVEEALRHLLGRAR